MMAKKARRTNKTHKKKRNPCFFFVSHLFRFVFFYMMIYCSCSDNKERRKINRMISLSFFFCRYESLYHFEDIIFDKKMRTKTKELMVPVRIELTTSALLARRSNQLS